MKTKIISMLMIFLMISCIGCLENEEEEVTIVEKEIKSFLINDINYFIIDYIPVTKDGFDMNTIPRNLSNYCVGNTVEIWESKLTTGIDNEITCVLFIGSDVETEMFNDICPSNYTIFQEITFESGNYVIVDFCQSELKAQIEAKKSEIESTELDIEDNMNNIEQMKSELEELEKTSYVIEVN